MGVHTVAATRPVTLLGSCTAQESCVIVLVTSGPAEKRDCLTQSLKKVYLPSIHNNEKFSTS